MSFIALLVIAFILIEVRPFSLIRAISSMAPQSNTAKLIVPKQKSQSDIYDEQTRNLIKLYTRME